MKGTIKTEYNELEYAAYRALCFIKHPLYSWEWRDYVTEPMYKLWFYDRKEDPTNWEGYVVYAVSKKEAEAMMINMVLNK